jgi:hypothetical protein
MWRLPNGQTVRSRLAYTTLTSVRVIFGTLLGWYQKLIRCGKSKFHPRTGHEGPEGEERYSCTLSLTSELCGVGVQRHAPAALPRERDPVPIVYDAGWAPGPVWKGAENLAPTGIRSLDRPARSESLYRLHCGNNTFCRCSLL